MFVKPSVSKEEINTDNVFSSKRGNSYRIKFGLFDRPIIKFEACELKFALGRFDKITIMHNDDQFMAEFQETIIRALKNDERYCPFKNEEIGVKVPLKLKEKVAGFLKNDVVDILVQFNDCWVMNSKIYASFTLADIKKSSKEKPKEVSFSFDDIV